ncbi:MAG: hypothetical protein P1V81_17995 [Planctomycetota bacterium]|nr:hypothetical protein [Planctomycetota bacterium]
MSPEVPTIDAPAQVPGPPALAGRSPRSWREDLVLASRAPQRDLAADPSPPR